VQNKEGRSGYFSLLSLASYVRRRETITEVQTGIEKLSRRHKAFAARIEY
jgi:hypothetical protein